MDEIEARLRAILQARAGTVDAAPRRRATIRLVRFRRARTTAVLVVTATLVAAGGGGWVRGALTVPPPGPAAEPEEETEGYEFEARAGSPPVIAEGTFRGARWTLQVDASGDDSDVDFKIESGDPDAGGTETSDCWEATGVGIPVGHGFPAQPGDTIDLYRGTFGEAAAGFAVGAVTDEAVSVTAELDDGRELPAAVFDGPQEPAPNADYFVVFLPHEANGKLIARDEAGNVVAEQGLEEEEESHYIIWLSGSLSSCGCRPSPGPTDEPSPMPRDAADYEFTWVEGEPPFIAGGTFKDGTWEMEIDTDPTHIKDPEEGESDPEVRLAFHESDGGHESYFPADAAGYPGGDALLQVSRATIDTDSGAADYIAGAVREGVATLTAELDGGMELSAAIFSGPDEYSGVDYFVVFVPTGTPGELVGRDGAGDVIGREDLPLHPSC